MKEIWKPLKDVVDKGDNYEVSTLGNLRNRNTGRVLTPSVNERGYVRIQLSYKGTTKKYSVHRLVALAHINNPKNHPEVNHIDGNKTNNKVHNLEWVTRDENIKHAKDNNLYSVFIGENHGNAKLTVNDVIQIKELLKVYTPTRDILAKFNIKKPTLSAIKTGATWSHVHVEGFVPSSSLVYGSNRCSSKIKEEDVMNIRDWHKSRKYNQSEMSRMFGVSTTVIKNIIHRKTWTHI
ncbi:DNA endonuclease [Bacillus phage vB_BceH_LY2]|nr:DNA endonuclease [Bacillus phage vB_BceH_LY2]